MFERKREARTYTPDEQLQAALKWQHTGEEPDPVVGKLGALGIGLTLTSKEELEVHNKLVERQKSQSQTVFEAKSRKPLVKRFGAAALSIIVSVTK